MSSWARPGVKCVCVDAWMTYNSPLVEGQIYEITAVNSGAYGQVGRYRNTPLSLSLNEVVNPFQPCGGFAIERFRPLITPEQDIALFHALCPGLPVVPPAVVPKRVKVTTPSD